jgi:4-diphosphocytidyl-2-C-methyl-D-erythritol kinase
MHAPYQRTFRAYAKINLLLRILGRETSGFHGIETVFQRIALHDLMHVSLSESTRCLECDGPSMPVEGLGTPEQNLAWRAAERYASATRWDTGWRIEIEKHIPVGGGLGGGSANAAGVLRAMEAMNPKPLGTGALLELAGTLGADVPFFVCDTSLAFAWSRGDRLLPLNPLPTMAVTLVTFEAGVNTAAAYTAFANARHDSRETVGAAHYPAGTFSSWESLMPFATNDFERVVPVFHGGVARVLPAVQREASRIRAGGAPAIGLLSGSGATCFLLHPPDSPVTLAPEFGTVVRTKTA